MQFRDELEPDEFDTYYNQETGEARNKPKNPTPQPQPDTPDPTPAPPTPTSDLHPDLTTNQIIKAAAHKLATATAIFIDNHSGPAQSDKTIRQIHSLAKSLKELHQVARKHRRPGRPKTAKKVRINPQ